MIGKKRQYFPKFVVFIIIEKSDCRLNLWGGDNLKTDIQGEHFDIRTM